MKNSFLKLVTALAITTSLAVGCSSTQQSTDSTDSTVTNPSMNTESGSMQDTISVPTDTLSRDTMRRDSM